MGTYKYKAFPALTLRWCRKHSATHRAECATQRSPGLLPIPKVISPRSRFLLSLRPSLGFYSITTREGIAIVRKIMQRTESHQSIDEDEEDPLLGAAIPSYNSSSASTPLYVAPPLLPASTPDELSSAQLAIILGSTYLGIILAALDRIMVATLTASICASYNSLSLLAWLASAYFIANSVLQPLAGKLTDIYGRRAGLVFCNVLFCVGNLICGLGKSEAVIILGRVVAGLGGGGLNKAKPQSKQACFSSRHQSERQSEASQLG